MAIATIDPIVSSQFDPAGTPKPVASWQHSAILITILLIIAAGGYRAQSNQASTIAAPQNALLVYVPLICSELLLVYAVWRGIRRSGMTLSQLVGGRWTTVRDIVADIARAVVLWVIIGGIAFAWERWMPAAHAPSISGLLPHSAIEIAVWVLLSIAAGAAEEIVFRGYLQRQFHAWTQNIGAAITLQALLFGISHGYQGIDACIRITIIGALFGVLAYWRRSLRPASSRTPGRTLPAEYSDCRNSRA